ncbi:Asp23/Gls24 family envelope stress response protein [Actinomycetospora chibensis]|uniref:Asp23/Gls24 family envelope stress response protein n=1 Tax=Actinomycetospora chibensis TaxID=663606 RepID=A0ABV9RGZ7_9PSEU|nr:Asp23/Gls24 family envelope stress response protein [Actinomycetospora chibensis]MDD7927657.1 Asp23/Gls24 family envelope stress response protein [Actinomycetospora chibensis]
MSTPTEGSSATPDQATGDAPTTPVARSGTVPLTETTRGTDPAPGTAVALAGSEEAAERGRLDVALSVVRKIAEYAADHTAGTVRTQRRLAGLDLGESGTSAKVSGYGEQVDLRLEVPLAYPARITDSAAAVRDHVRERVQALTPYRVRSLDIGVSALTDPAARAIPRTPTSRTE